MERQALTLLVIKIISEDWILDLNPNTSQSSSTAVTYEYCPQKQVMWSISDKNSTVVLTIPLTIFAKMMSELGR